MVENDLSVSAREQNASFGALFEKVNTAQKGQAPVQSRWGTNVVGTEPPAGVPSDRINHGGLPATGWGEVERNANGLVRPATARTKD